jgi:hypothetical protein
MQLIGLRLVGARAKHGRDHPHAALQTVSTTLCFICSPSGFMGLNLPPESSNAEISMAGLTAWVLSLPSSKLRHPTARCSFSAVCGAVVLRA